MSTLLSEFTIFGVTFHTYGVIMAVAIALVLKIAEKHIGGNQTRKDSFWDATAWMLIGAGIGSRLWHVITDWHLYEDNPVGGLYIWRGGLSIIGALVGVVLAAWLFTKYRTKKFSFLELLDAIVLGVPFSQAVGRLGNWINQELYGVPTDLPWKLFVAEEHRLAGYENQAFYHPLFLYEALLMIVVGVLLLFGVKKLQRFTIGSGFITLAYFALYGWIRFFLEFLRIDKTVVGGSSLGLNQSILVVVAVVATGLLWKKYIKEVREDA